MPISLSTKKSRDSNIFSKTSSIPAALRRGDDGGGHDVGRERRPGAVLELGHVAAEVGADPPLLVGVDVRRLAVDPRPDAEPLEAQQRAAEIVSARTGSMVISPLVTAARPMKLPISM